MQVVILSNILPLTFEHDDKGAVVADEHHQRRLGTTGDGRQAQLTASEGFKKLRRR